MRCVTMPAAALLFGTIGLIAVTGVSPAKAETRPVRGETIKYLISGGTVHLDTPIGATLPLKFSPDGTVTGTSVVLAFYLGSTADRGRWWISGDKLCTKWTRWFDGDQSCLTIRPEGRKFAWTKDDGDTGTASIVSAPKQTYSSVSALGGGVSAATLVRNAEERIATEAAKSKAAEQAKRVRLAALIAPSAPQSKPKPVVQLQPSPSAEDGPQSWLPMSAVKAPAEPLLTPVAFNTAAVPAAPRRALLLTYKVARVAADDVLNVRSGPDGDAPVVGTIPPTGRGLVMKGVCQNDWCPVGYVRQSGWVSRQFIDLESAP